MHEVIHGYFLNFEELLCLPVCLTCWILRFGTFFQGNFKNWIQNFILRITAPACTKMFYIITKFTTMKYLIYDSLSWWNFIVYSAIANLPVSQNYNNCTSFNYNLVFPLNISLLIHFFIDYILIWYIGMPGRQRKVSNNVLNFAEYRNELSTNPNCGTT